MANDNSAVGILTPLVGYHLRRANGAFLADFSEVMDGTGMRQVLVGVLAVVSREPGINQGAAGRLLGITRGNMVSLVNELEEAGLIQRVVHPDDRRAFALQLTPAGADRLDDCLKRIAAHEDRMLSRLTARERGLLLDLLTRVGRAERRVD